MSLTQLKIAPTRMRLQHSIAPEFADRAWDFSHFDVGERFFHQPVPREEYDQLLREAERWGLDDQMQSNVFDDLVFEPALAS
jgi:hypothetical protein